MNIIQSAASLAVATGDNLHANIWFIGSCIAILVFAFLLLSPIDIHK